jgi:hypothetical protein
MYTEDISRDRAIRSSNSMVFPCCKRTHNYWPSAAVSGSDTMTEQVLLTTHETNRYKMADNCTKASPETLSALLKTLNHFILSLKQGIQTCSSLLESFRSGYRCGLPRSFNIHAGSFMVAIHGFGFVRYIPLQIIEQVFGNNRVVFSGKHDMQWKN